MGTEARYSFKEVEMMVASAEKVTERRINNNKTNYSVNIAVIIAIAFIWRWTITHTDYFFCGQLMIIIIGSLAILFCSLWIKQITDFKLLNAAKFEVINEMSENIIFESSNTTLDIISYEPFKKEWEKLKKLKGLQEQTQNRIVVLKSTFTEYFIPKSFRIIFMLILAFSIISIIFNPSETWEGIKFFLKLN